MTEIVRQDSYATATLSEKREYVSAIAQAGDLLPKALWTKPQMVNGVMQQAQPSPAKVLLLAETGSMLGLHPMAALTGIYIIEGKPTLSANLLGALVRRAGHKLRVTTTGKWADGTFVARAVLIRSDDPDFEFVVEWTPERAKQAGLLGKGNWKTYPEAMAKARAITEVIREGAPDVTLVPAYTPEELGAEVKGEEGEVVEMPASRDPKPQAPIQEPKSAAKPKAAAKPRAAAKPKAKPGVQRASEVITGVPAGSVVVEDNGHAVVVDMDTDLETGEIVEPEVEEAHAPDERSAYARAEADATDPENIEDAQLVENAEQTDWEALLKEAESIDQVRALYADARSQGLLGTEITWAGEARPLGAVITEVGQGFAALQSEG